MTVNKDDLNEIIWECRWCGNPNQGGAADKGDFSEEDFSGIVWGFEPNYVVPPGGTLEDALEEKGLTSDDLARRTGMSVEHIGRLLTGEAPITYVTALKLEAATDVCAGLWNDLEEGYRKDLVRLAEQERLTQQLPLLDDLPVDEMIEMGLLAKPHPPIDWLQRVFDFFGVEDREGWEEARRRERETRFRGRPNGAPGALEVWLRLGELEAELIECEPWNPARFREALRAARTLTADDNPGCWFPQLTAQCARAGVAVVAVPQLKSAPVNGAARWLSPERALIQLPVRNEWSDVFWFSFFHEASHVLDEQRDPIFINSPGGERDREERRADDFARDWLIPPPHAGRLAEVRTPGQAEELARDLGVHPGIVVGRLQHDRIWPRRRGDGLRQPLQWAGTPGRKKPEPKPVALEDI